MRNRIEKGFEINFIILETIQDISSLGEREEFWISEKRSEGHDLTNLTEGGDGTVGRVVSDELKLKIKDDQLRFLAKNPEYAATLHKRFEKYFEENPDAHKKQGKFVSNWFKENPDLVQKRSEKRRQTTIEGFKEYLTRTDTTGYPGVTWCKSKNYWDVRVFHVPLGQFKNHDDAVALKRKAEQFLIDGGDLKEFKEQIRKTPDEITKSYKERGLRTRIKNRKKEINSIREECA